MLTHGHVQHQCTYALHSLSIWASGGNLRLSTWDGDLLQDSESLPDSCKFFNLTFVKQVGELPQGMSSLSDMRAQGPSSSGQMSPQYAHMLDTLLIHAAMSGEDNSITVDIRGTQMVVNPVYANDGRVLGILYQHAHTEKQCMLQRRGVDLIQVDVSYTMG